MNGKPLVFGEVQVVSDNQTVSGELDETGSYDISNAPVGPVKIAILAPKRLGSSQGRDRIAAGQKKNAAREKEGVPDIVYRIPDSYRTPTQSGLETTVSPDGQTVFDIAIKIR
ncbi:MAG: hypothetical protein U0792_12745 [Gemmataceae bacterium]